MIRRAFPGILFLLGVSAMCSSLSGSLAAQTEKTITVRMLDSRTGRLIATSDYLVRFDHEKTGRGNLVTKNEDGTGTLTVPGNATVLSIRATYESNTLTYANCDASKDVGSSEHAPSLDHWYKISDILTMGVVAPNGCAGKKVPDKLQVVAKPGEFVFFVRKLNAREEYEN
jgi:hypothetical protein